MDQHDFENIERMSPENSPGETSGVRRVNNIPIVIVVAALLLFIGVFSYSMYGKSLSQKQNIKEKSEQQSIFAAEQATKSLLEGIPQGGYVPEKSKPPEIPTVKVAALPEDGPPLPPGKTSIVIKKTAPPQGLSEAQKRIQALKLQRLQEALEAKIGIDATDPKEKSRDRSNYTSSVAAVGVSTPQNNQAMLNRLASMKQQLANAQRDNSYTEKLAALQSHQSKLGLEQGKQRTITASQAPQQKDRWTLNQTVTTPEPYQLKTGFVIPGIMISGINSELPGQIIGQVSQNVYDTATGGFLLIPQGTRLIGQYSSKVTYGQSRILVAWQRLIFPDGKAIYIETMPGTDGAGYAGFNDIVDNHYIRIFGSALLMSGITAGVELSQNDDDYNDDDDDSSKVSDTLREALGLQLGQVSASLIQKNLNISPTIKIRPGFRFNVIVTKDITFSTPYQAFDY
jgi:type IV secretion system protein VirB10